MNEKKVSFVVPIYGTEDYLEKSLQSLINQDYKNLEIICVADGESKKAEEIFNKLKEKDERLVKYITIEHGGAPKARNEGYKHTVGDFVSFWDSDCYAEPGMVRMWCKVFNLYPDISFVYSGYRFNDENLSFLSSEPFNPYLITCNNYIATMFPMKRDIFPGFDENLKSLQDWDLWLTLVEKGYRGFFLEGSGFVAEHSRQGSISAEGCKPDIWLSRYEAVRDKHGIKDRDVCFTSILHKFRAIELAEMFKQDYNDMPSYHPHRYKMIYCIGFYAENMEMASRVFRGAGPDCLRVIHWMGEDVETLFRMPYAAVKILKESIHDSIDKHYCENEQTKKMLEELDIKSEIMPLPMKYEEVPKPDKFRVYYEFDNATDQLMRSIVRACPDIEFVNASMCSLKEFVCFLSLTGSIMPSENLKRFGAAGRAVITNYRTLHSGNIELNKEKIVRRLRELKKNPADGCTEDMQKYWQDIIKPDEFQKRVIDNAKNIVCSTGA